MTKNDRRGTTGRPSSAPPSVAQVDATWDDETVPGLDLDDPLNAFDRITVVPELPSDLYVKRVMASAEESSAPIGSLVPPEPPAAPVTLSPDEYFSLDSEPPPKPRSADSTAPYAAMLPQSAPTARPAAAAVTVPAPAPARSPGVPRQSASLTGLELTELDSIGSLRAEPSSPPPIARDPRDPVFELSFDDPPRRFKEPGAGALGELKDRYAIGDFSGALEIAQGIIESNPQDLEAPRYAQSCRDVLTQMHSARLGALDQLVALAVPVDRIRWLTLDHRAGFLLSLIDGGSSVEQILDISGMTRLDALHIMCQLLDQRVISLG